MIQLERVRPTEDAILEMVRNHYSHRENIKQRPRTEKTSKTWWSNARLVVFSDPERTLVFAWQWPKDGIRKDGQNGFNNTLFHRSDRCPYQASDIVLAAERAVVAHWGENRAFTYVDAEKVKSANPGYCYKMAGWKHIADAIMKHQPATVIALGSIAASGVMAAMSRIDKDERFQFQFITGPHPAARQDPIPRLREIAQEVMPKVQDREAMGK